VRREELVRSQGCPHTEEFLCWRSIGGIFCAHAVEDLLNGRGPLISGHQPAEIDSQGEGVDGKRIQFSGLFRGIRAGNDLLVSRSIYDFLRQGVTLGRGPVGVEADLTLKGGFALETCEVKIGNDSSIESEEDIGRSQISMDDMSSMDGTQAMKAICDDAASGILAKFADLVEADQVTQTCLVERVKEDLLFGSFLRLEAKIPLELDHPPTVLK
jgi:hypothetical protein